MASYSSTIFPFPFPFPFPFSLIRCERDNPTFNHDK